MDMDENGSNKVKAMEAAYWGEYGALMECVRRGERLAFERWGRVENGELPAVDGRQAVEMRQLRQGLEALWVGFGEL